MVPAHNIVDDHQSVTLLLCFRHEQTGFDSDLIVVIVVTGDLVFPLGGHASGLAEREKEEK